MKIQNSDSLKTILVICLGFTFIFLVTEWKWALFIGFSIGILGLISRYLRDKIDFLWMKLAWILSFIVPNIILGLIFYLVLFPISLLSKLFGNKDPLRLKNPVESVYVTNNKEFSLKSFENTW